MLMLKKQFLYIYHATVISNIVLLNIFSYLPRPTQCSCFLFSFFFSIFKRVLWKKALCFAFDDGCPPLLLPLPWQPVTTRCLLPLHVFNNNCVAYFSAMGLALNFKGLVQLCACVCVCVQRAAASNGLQQINYS